MSNDVYAMIYIGVLIALVAIIVEASRWLAKKRRKP
jgi:hypothetical protein